MQKGRITISTMGKVTLAGTKKGKERQEKGATKGKEREEERYQREGASIKDRKGKSNQREERTTQQNTTAEKYVPPCHPPPTLSPRLNPFTPSPRAATSPMISCPKILGNDVGIIPAVTKASVWQIPHASTFTRIWPGPGGIKGKDCSSRGWFSPVSTAARNVLGRLLIVDMVDSADKSRRVGE